MKLPSGARTFLCLGRGTGLFIQDSTSSSSLLPFANISLFLPFSFSFLSLLTSSLSRNLVSLSSPDSRRCRRPRRLRRLCEGLSSARPRGSRLRGRLRHQSDLGRPRITPPTTTSTTTSALAASNTSPPPMVTFTTATSGHIITMTDNDPR